MLSSEEWEKLCRAVGLVKLSAVRNDDSLGREQVAWLSFLFQKPEESGDVVRGKSGESMSKGAQQACPRSDSRYPC